MTRSLDDDRVETPKQVAERVGVSDYLIRQLIRTGELEHVRIGGRIFIPNGAWTRYVAANTKGGRECQGETMDRAPLSRRSRRVARLLDRSQGARRQP